MLSKMDVEILKKCMVKSIHLMYPCIWMLFKCIWILIQILLNLMKLYMDTAKLKESGDFSDMDTFLPNSAVHVTRPLQV